MEELDMDYDITCDNLVDYTGRLTKGSVELADALLKALEEF